MRRLSIKFWGSVLVLLLGFSGSLWSSIGVAGVGAPPLNLIDDRGRSIYLGHSAERIVSLSPSITELIFAAGAGGKLVGASRYSNYPDAAKSLPDIGDSSSLDLERIIALKPDLVMAWRSGNASSDLEKLENLGLTVFATEAAKLEDVPRLLRTAGKLAGTLKQAESAAKAYEDELRQIKLSYGGRRKIRVFPLIWHQPLMTVNGNHVISDIIDMCGGTNVFALVPSLAPVISPENLLETDPQAIVSSVWFESADALQPLLRRLSRISAVRKKHVFFVHPDLLQRQTTRMLSAAKTICQQLERVRSSQKRGLGVSRLIPVESS